MNTSFRAGPKTRSAIVKDFQELRDYVYRQLTKHEALENASYSNVDSDLERSEQDDIEGRLGDALKSAGERTLVYAEALGMPALRGRIEAWIARWQDKLGTVAQWQTQDDVGSYSPAYAELRPNHDALTLLCGPSTTTADQVLSTLRRSDHERLEFTLRSIPKYCAENKELPQSEADVRRVMHSLLETPYSDYSREFTLPRPLLNFKPDSGIPSLRAAIECKYVSKKAGVNAALHGLTEDLSGYAGNRDWTRFYSFVYMTGAYAVEGAIDRALKSSGNADRWTTICVVGPGGHKAKRTRARMI